MEVSILLFKFVKLTVFNNNNEMKHDDHKWICLPATLPHHQDAANILTIFYTITLLCFGKLNLWATPRNETELFTGEMVNKYFECGVLMTKHHPDWCYI
jgi:hypothetical protein